MTGEQQQQKILLIEDDKFMTDLIAMRFKKDGLGRSHKNRKLKIKSCPTAPF